jgi:hypothetical protein
MTDEPELTPLQIDMAATGRVYFTCPAPVYVAMGQQIDARRNYPTPHTARALPPLEQVGRDAEGNVLVSVATRQVTAADWDMLNEAVANGHGVQITSAEYEAWLVREDEE